MKGIENKAGHFDGENGELPATAHNYAGLGEWPGPKAEEPMTPDEAEKRKIAIDGLYGRMDHMGG